MLLFLREDLLHQPARNRVFLAEEMRHLPIGFDHDAFRDQVFTDHVGERDAFFVFGVTHFYDLDRVHLGFAAELLDARGEPPGMFLLFIRVLSKLVSDRFGMDAGGHEVMKLIAQHADDFGRERLVQDAYDLIAVQRVIFGDRPVFNMLARPRPNLFQLAHKSHNRSPPSTVDDVCKSNTANEHRHATTASMNLQYGNGPSLLRNSARSSETFRHAICVTKSGPMDA